MEENQLAYDAPPKIGWQRTPRTFVRDGEVYTEQPKHVTWTPGAGWQPSPKAAFHTPSRHATKPGQSKRHGGEHAAIATLAFKYNPMNYLTRRQRAHYNDRERHSFETQATERALFELTGIMPQ